MTVPKSTHLRRAQNPDGRIECATLAKGRIAGKWASATLLLLCFKTQTGRAQTSLTRIDNGHPNRDIDQLLPWAYKSKTSEPWPENSAY
jgi:hypothetical protein